MTHRLLIASFVLGAFALLLPYSNDSVFFVYFSLSLILFYLKSLNYKFGDPQVIILMGIILFNSRPFLDVIFDTNTFGDTHGFFKTGSFNDEYLIGSVIFIKASILAYMVGMFRVNLKVEDRKNIAIFDFKQNSYFKNYLIFLLFPTLSSCIALILLCYLNGGYSYFNSGNNIVSILRRFIPLLTVCLTINLLFYKKRVITGLIVLTSLSICILVGARIIGLMPIFSLMVYCSFKYKKEYNKFLPIFVFLVIFLTVFVNFFRAGFKIDQDVDIMFFIQFFLNEISFTTNLIPMSFEYVASNGFAYGINYLGAFFSVIPKLAFWMRVSPETYSFSSALGMFYDPLSISKGLGLNGSLLGESYFSFGYFGVVFIFFLSVLFNRFYRLNIESKISSFILISSSPYLMTVFIFESTIVFRGFFYYSILPVLVYIIVIKRFSRNKDA